MWVAAHTSKGKGRDSEIFTVTPRKTGMCLSKLDVFYECVYYMKCETVFENLGQPRTFVIDFIIS